MTSIRIRFKKHGTALLFAILAAPLSGFAQSNSELIAMAVRPLPEDLKAQATVFDYDTQTGERMVLRQGSNHVECRPKDERSFTRCFPVGDAGRRDFIAKLTAQGKSSEEIDEAVAQAIASGNIKPREFGSISYRLYDEADRIQLLWIVYLPNATSDMMGMPTGSQRDNALAGKGLPWMMLEGTPGAHLMIPINGTEFSNQAN